LLEGSLAIICDGGLLIPSSPPPACLQVTSYSLATRMEAEVVNGPALTQQKLPFSWTNWPDEK